MFPISGKMAQISVFHVVILNIVFTNYLSQCKGWKQDMLGNCKVVTSGNGCDNGNAGCIVVLIVTVIMVVVVVVVIY